jgi:hypothetical protein
MLGRGCGTAAVAAGAGLKFRGNENEQCGIPPVLKCSHDLRLSGNSDLRFKVSNGLPPECPTDDP